MEVEQREKEEEGSRGRQNGRRRKEDSGLYSRQDTHLDFFFFKLTHHCSCRWIEN